MTTTSGGVFSSEESGPFMDPEYERIQDDLWRYGPIIADECHRLKRRPHPTKTAQETQNND